MKRLLHTALLLWFALFAGCKIRDELNVMDRDGLSLYWHHAADTQKGRYLFFSFLNAEPSTEKFDYKFEYKIQGRVIDVRLTEKISKGKCPIFPGSYGDECSSWGNIYIPESELSQGTYQFRLQTGKSIVTSELVVGDIQFELKVPANGHFINRVPVIYAIPKNIVFGAVSYNGAANELFASALIDDLTKAGLKPAIVPPHPYEFMMRDNRPHLSKDFWEPDNYSIFLLFSWNGEHKRVAEICKEHFEKSQKRLGIALWNSDFMEQITAEQNGNFTTFLR
ncbi:hypothetical protein SAMN04487996_101238 [Dyadobacter soli]|uniref:Uncharacterized protein n=1 Tax=Dyadobacter soli TaxID=659014 RepID=A0A1G6VG67_9BACT|nr:hypothetical protein [Dyadobacter soli]SDD52662.1 hypothetical protein SAMN04487996_101238 [Dyadobacter soli]